MRWFTCTPKSFVGNQIFFDRDSGLLSRGFQSIGIESRAISLGPARDDDFPELLRATRDELDSPRWWDKLKLDGLVFYSWGSPSYQSIANAITTVGIPLVQVSDNHGIYSPLNDWPAHLTTAWAHQWYESDFKKLLRTLMKIPVSHTLGILRNDRALVKMMTTCDWFASATPKSTERLRRMTRILKGREAANKICTLPLPVNFHFGLAAEIEKADEVVAVGRWEHPQKRVDLLMATVAIAAETRPTTAFRIFGNLAPPLVQWHKHLPDNLRSRIVLEGLVPNKKLLRAYQHARVMLVTAAYEGCHNASAEALCCGCSVVAPRSPFLSALEWHSSRDSGSIADSHTPEALAGTLCSELSLWDAGRRNAVEISSTWSEVFLPNRVAQGVIDLFQMK